jgi:LuxR family maltose regulon positive regulatory protein
MQMLLWEAMRRGIEIDYIQKLLSAFHTGEATQRPEAPGVPAPAFQPSTLALSDPLSEREIEVLQFLQTHLTIPEIAREMSIAPSTLRTHVRNIYMKLDVHGRIEAIQKAKGFALF